MAPFPPVLVAALGVVGAALLVRHIAREVQRARDVDRTAKATVAKAQEQPVRKLRRDPQTGIYRP